jgi:hypothetical protein
MASDEDDEVVDISNKPNESKKQLNTAEGNENHIPKLNCVPDDNSHDADPQADAPKELPQRQNSKIAFQDTSSKITSPQNSKLPTSPERKGENESSSMDDSGYNFEPTSVYSRIAFNIQSVIQPNNTINETSEYKVSVDGIQREPSHGSTTPINSRRSSMSTNVTEPIVETMKSDDDEKHTKYESPRQDISVDNRMSSFHNNSCVSTDAGSHYYSAICNDGTPPDTLMNKSECSLQWKDISDCSVQEMYGDKLENYESDTPVQRKKKIHKFMSVSKNDVSRSLVDISDCKVVQINEHENELDDKDDEKSYHNKHMTYKINNKVYKTTKDENSSSSNSHTHNPSKYDRIYGSILYNHVADMFRGIFRDTISSHPSSVLPTSENPSEDV